MRKFIPLKRQIEKFESKARFTLYTEGEKTEPSYFYSLRDMLGGAIVNLTAVPSGSPMTIADKASRHAKQRSKSSFANRDRIWAVFDRDEHPNVEDAINKCEANGVGIAFSNPCFELWLILHYEDFDKSDQRHAVQKHMETCCDKYDRRGSKTPDCAKLIQNVVAAENRAERQLKRREQEGGRNAPFTTVYELTRAIRIEAEVAIGGNI